VLYVASFNLRRNIIVLRTYNPMLNFDRRL
jgi:hypothetical protein